jgi:hypothetical protein
MIAVSSRLPRVALVLLIGSLVLAALTPAVQAVTKSEVEAACVDSREALGVYREARGRFDEAARELEQINFKVDETAAQTVAVRSRIADREDDLKRLIDRVEDNAVEMYMQGVMGTALVFSAGSSEEIVAGTEYLSVTAGDDLNAINDLAALRSDLAAGSAPNRTRRPPTGRRQIPGDGEWSARSWSAVAAPGERGRDQDPRPRAM